MMLNGKTAMITGGAQGIGAALADGLATNGGGIIIADLPSQQAAFEVVRAAVQAKDRTCHFVEMDVTKKASVEAGIAAAGQIDILVNNAGILAAQPLEDLTEESWDAHFDVNAKGVLLVTNEVLKQMRSRKAGRIINIASLAAR